jgi:hypothetical protein
VWTGAAGWALCGHGSSLGDSKGSDASDEGEKEGCAELHAAALDEGSCASRLEVSMLSQLPHGTLQKEAEHSPAGGATTRGFMHACRRMAQRPALLDPFSWAWAYPGSGGCAMAPCASAS